MSNEKPVMLTQQDNPLAMLAREVESLRAQLAAAKADHERIEGEQLEYWATKFDCGVPILAQLVDKDRELEWMRGALRDMIEIYDDADLKHDEPPDATTVVSTARALIAAPAEEEKT